MSTPTITSAPSRFAFDTAPKLNMGINAQENPISQGGYYYVTTRQIWQAIKASKWTKGESTKKVALTLIDRTEGTLAWFENGFDWKLALAIPDMLLASKIKGKVRNVRFPIKIKI